MWAQKLGKYTHKLALDLQERCSLSDAQKFVRKIRKTVAEDDGRLTSQVAAKEHLISGHHLGFELLRRKDFV